MLPCALFVTQAQIVIGQGEIDTRLRGNVDGRGEVGHAGRIRPDGLTEKRRAKIRCRREALPADAASPYPALGHNQAKLPATTSP